MERMEKDFQPVIYYCYDAYCLVALALMGAIIGAWR